MIITISALVLATLLSAPPNACYITSTHRGQYVVQTDGSAGTLSVYVNGEYATTVSRLNALWYATKDKAARVAAYDGSGRVC